MSDDQRSFYYQSLDEFVSSFIAAMYARQVGPRGEYRWSARWWQSQEAVLRLKICWRAFEIYRWDPNLGMHSAIQVMDYHMRFLLASDGPFAQSETAADWGEPLPCDPTPRAVNDVADHESMSTKVRKARERQTRQQHLRMGGERIDPETGEVLTPPPAEPPAPVVVGMVEVIDDDLDSVTPDHSPAPPQGPPPVGPEPRTVGGIHIFDDDD